MVINMSFPSYKELRICWLPICSLRCFTSTIIRGFSKPNPSGEAMISLPRSAHRCEFKEHYEANINIPVRYSDPDSITNIRQVLAYMTKIQQKHGLLLYGCNEVPARPLTGRPRSSQSL